MRTKLQKKDRYGNNNPTKFARLPYLFLLGLAILHIFTNFALQNGYVLLRNILSRRHTPTSTDPK